MNMLSKDIILSIHKKLIEDTGGIYGVRDESLLESALYAPFSEYGGIELTCGNDALAELGLGIASSETDYQEIVDWLNINTRRRT